MMQVQVNDNIRKQIAKQKYYIIADKPRFKGTPPWRKAVLVNGKTNKVSLKNILYDTENRWLRQYEEHPRSLNCSRCNHQHAFAHKKTEDGLIWKKKKCERCGESSVLKNWTCECGITIRQCDKHRAEYHESKEDDRVVKKRIEKKRIFW